MPEIMSNTNFFVYQYLLYCQIVLLKIQRDMSKDDDASMSISTKCCSMLLLWFYLVQKHALMNHQYLIFRPYKIHHHTIESFQIVWQLKVFCTFCFNFIVKCLINKIENAFKSLTFEFSRNVFTEMFVIKRVQTCSLSCWRPKCCLSTKTQMRDRNFKLTPIHASVIYQIPQICWIHWISVPLREIGHFGIRIPQNWKPMRTFTFLNMLVGFSIIEAFLNIESVLFAQLFALLLSVTTGK